MGVGAIAAVGSGVSIGSAVGIGVDVATGSSVVFGMSVGVADVTGTSVGALNALLVSQNNIKPEMISHALFTLTEDLNAAFPAKFARLDLGWTDVPMMCFNEISVPNSLAKCLRIMVVINCEENFSPKFVYLDGAEGLRK